VLISEALGKTGPTDESSGGAGSPLRPRGAPPADQEGRRVGWFCGRLQFIGLIYASKLLSSPRAHKAVLPRAARGPACSLGRGRKGAAPGLPPSVTGSNHRRPVRRRHAPAGAGPHPTGPSRARGAPVAGRESLPPLPAVHLSPTPRGGRWRWRAPPRNGRPSHRHAVPAATRTPNTGGRPGAPAAPAPLVRASTHRGAADTASVARRVGTRARPRASGRARAGGRGGGASVAGTRWSSAAPRGAGGARAVAAVTRRPRARSAVAPAPPPWHATQSVARGGGWGPRRGRITDRLWRCCSLVGRACSRFFCSRIFPPGGENTPLAETPAVRWWVHHRPPLGRSDGRLWGTPQQRLGVVVGVAALAAVFCARHPPVSARKAGHPLRPEGAVRP